MNNFNHKDVIMNNNNSGLNFNKTLDHFDKIIESCRMFFVNKLLQCPNGPAISEDIDSQLSDIFN